MLVVEIMEDTFSSRRGGPMTSYGFSTGTFLVSDGSVRSSGSSIYDKFSSLDPSIKDFSDFLILIGLIFSSSNGFFYS